MVCDLGAMSCEQGGMKTIDLREYARPTCLLERKQNICLEDTGFSIIISLPGMSYFLCVIDQGGPGTHQMMAIAIALGFPLELDGKALFLNIQHTLVARHREIKLELT